jgi:hypothetical protein
MVIVLFGCCKHETSFARFSVVKITKKIKLKESDKKGHRGKGS